MTKTKLMLVIGIGVALVWMVLLPRRVGAKIDNGANRAQHSLAQANCKPNSLFVADVTIPDGALLAPGQAFTKTWRLRNSGTCNWGNTYSIVFVRGDNMAIASTYTVPVTLAKSTADISIPMMAPLGYGRYAGEWQLQNNGVRVGFPLTVIIRVDPKAPTLTPTSLITTPTTTTRLTATPTSTYTTEAPSTFTPTATNTSSPVPLTKPPPTIPAPPATPSIGAPTEPTPNDTPTSETPIPNTPTPTSTETPSPFNLNQLVSTVLGVIDEGDNPNQPRLLIALVACFAFLLLLLLLFIVRDLGRRKRKGQQQQLPPEKSLPPTTTPTGGAKTARLITTPHLTGAAIPNGFELTNPTWIGRADTMSFAIPAAIAGAASVSPEHARIEKRGARWIIVDGVETGRPSQTGIFVNGKRTRVNYLKEGDVIRLGQVEFDFHAPQGGMQ